MLHLPGAVLWCVAGGNHRDGRRARLARHAAGNPVYC